MVLGFWVERKDLRVVKYGFENSGRRSVYHLDDIVVRSKWTGSVEGSEWGWEDVELGLEGNRVDCFRVVVAFGAGEAGVAVEEDAATDSG